MTYSTPFPLVQFQFQVGGSGSPQIAAYPHGELVARTDGGSALSLRRDTARTAFARLRSGLFASQFREICNL